MVVVTVGGEDYYEMMLMGGQKMDPELWIRDRDWFLPSGDRSMQPVNGIVKIWVK